MKADKEVVSAAVKQNGRALEYASAKLKADDAVVLAGLSAMNGVLASKLKDDKEVVMAPVEKNGNALQYWYPNLKDDKEVVVAAEVVKLL
jgi:hypothetical protein